MSKKQPLENATEIIERFGGIRPMAAKIDAPVTTVQGWKKRDVIPGTRRVQILDAASENNIDLSDLVEVAVSATPSNENVSKSKPKKKATASKPKKKSVEESEGKTPEPISSVSPVLSVSPDAADSEAVEAETIAEEDEPQSTEEGAPLKHDILMSELKENNRKTMVASAWIATGLILLAIAVGFFLLWPRFENSKAQLAAQSQQLVDLEGKVENVKIENQEKFLGTSLPAGLQERFDGLQNQARNISVTVDQLSERAKAISMEALGDSSEAISERLEVLENKIEELSGPDGSFAGLVARIRELENSIVGQAQLKNSANQLRSIMGSVNGGGTINEGLTEAQTENNGGALGRTLEGVPGEDLKAAAILIAFSQFRSSLEREVPFEQDLALLQKLIGDDNPELQENLTRLSQHADGGVLTAPGLSRELKKLTGDIVVSSLNGEEVSIKEKAKARFGSIIQIEKDGELLSGTKTQATVAKAQEYVEDGKVEDSISALEGLDGEAAEVVQPFLEKAKASLLAEKVKAMLNESILSKAGGESGASESSGLLGDFQLPDINVDGLKQDLENTVPLIGQPDIVKDEESGLVILPKNSSSFKGFSGGDYE